MVHKTMDIKQIQWNVQQSITDLSTGKILCFKLPGIRLTLHTNSLMPNALQVHVNFNSGSGYINNNHCFNKDNRQYGIVFCQLRTVTDPDEYVDQCNINVINIPIVDVDTISFSVQSVPMIHYGIVSVMSNSKPSGNRCLSLMEACLSATVVKSRCIGIFKDFADNDEIYRWLFRDDQGRKVLYNLLLPMWHGKRKCIVNRIGYTLPGYDNYTGKDPKKWFKTLISLAGKGDHMWDIINAMKFGYNGKCFKMSCSPPSCDISTCPIYILPESSKTPLISSRFKWDNDDDEDSSEDTQTSDLSDLEI
jgi:hypothetical protein